MSVTDEFLANNESYAAGFGKGDLAIPPAKQVAVLACMDARLDPARALGLEEGDALRSLALSQRLLGTKEIILIHHTDCGMVTFTDDEVKAQIEQDTGIRPPFALESFKDADADVRQSIARIAASPFLPDKSSVRGFVYDVKTGKLREVS
jgi:carbonic anhydrase